MKISLQAALTQIKSITTELNKTPILVGMNSAGHPEVDSKLGVAYAPEKFKEIVTQKYGEYNELSTKLEKLIKGVITANSTTTVEYNEQTYTIATLIAYKNKIVPTKQYLLDTLRYQLTGAQGSISSQNSRLLEEKKVSTNEAYKIPSDSSKKTTIEIIEKNYEASEKKLVDPIKILDIIDKLEREVNKANMEIDIILSEKNATTFIEI